MINSIPFSLISLLVAISALCFSIYVFYKNSLYSKAKIEIDVFNKIACSKETMGHAKVDKIVFEGDNSPTATAVKDKWLASVHNFLSDCDSACKKYYDNEFSCDSFDALSFNYFIKTVSSLSDEFSLEHYNYLTKYIDKLKNSEFL